MPFTTIHDTIAMSSNEIMKRASSSITVLFAMLFSIEFEELPSRFIHTQASMDDVLIKAGEGETRASWNDIAREFTKPTYLVELTQQPQENGIKFFQEFYSRPFHREVSELKGRSEPGRTAISSSV